MSQQAHAETRTLADYAKHDDDCTQRKAHIEVINYRLMAIPAVPCSCGLQALLDAGAAKDSRHAETLRQMLRYNLPNAEERAALEVGAAALSDQPDYKRALENHLCEHDMADWLGCSLNHNDACTVCQHDNGTEHTWLARAEAAEAKLAALSVPEGWQPIKTAPKDGTKVLTYCATTSFSHQRFDLMHHSGRWRPIYGGLANAPTHWMPLPAPPTEAK